MLIKDESALTRFLSGKWLPLVLVLIALLLLSGSVGTGLHFDDYSHQMILKRSGSYSHPLTSLFAFMDNPGQAVVLMKYGILPWWTTQALHLSFFRPLAAATHWLDYQLWPNEPVLMHLHSLLWFALVIYVAALIYRKVMTPFWIAGLAALLFAIDDAHGVPAGWIANRSVLIAALFGFLSLFFHIRRRREGWKAGALLSPICFLLGLLSAEAGVATGAYLVSYELCLASDHWRKRIASIAPYAAIGAVWWICYHAMGFGAYGSGAYIDPGRTPLAFLGVLPERIPLMLYGLWSIPNIGIYGFLPKPFAYFILMGIYALIAAAVFIIMPLLKRDPVSRFWALGTLLALMPFAATFPDNRLLFFSGLGAMGLLARFLATWFEKPGWLRTSRIRRGLGHLLVAVLIIANLIAAPLLLPAQSKSLATMTEVTLDKPLAALSHDINLGGKTLVLVNPPIPFVFTFLSYSCEKLGLEAPATTRTLISGLTSRLNIRRVDAYSLEIEPENGFITQHLEKLFRGPETPMRVGQMVDTDDMRALVLSLTNDQRPLRVRFTFLKPLEDPSMVFLVWRNDSLMPFHLPEVGQSVRIEPLVVIGNG